MQDVSAYGDDSRGTQGQPYSEADEALIREMAQRRVTRLEIRQRFPHRSTHSIKKKIAVERTRQGLVKRRCLNTYVSLPMLDPDDPGFDDRIQVRRERDQAQACNRAFLQALNGGH